MNFSSQKVNRSSIRNVDCKTNQVVVLTAELLVVGHEADLMENPVKCIP